MEKSLIHSNELHFISKKRAVVESYFTDLEKRKEINQLLNLEQDVCEEIEAELSYK